MGSDNHPPTLHRLKHRPGSARAQTYRMHQPGPAGQAAACSSDVHFSRHHRGTCGAPPTGRSPATKQGSCSRSAPGTEAPPTLGFQMSSRRWRHPRSADLLAPNPPCLPPTLHRLRWTRTTAPPQGSDSRPRPPNVLVCLWSLTAAGGPAGLMESRTVCQDLVFLIYLVISK